MAPAPTQHEEAAPATRTGILTKKIGNSTFSLLNPLNIKRPSSTNPSDSTTLPGNTERSAAFVSRRAGEVGNCRSVPGHRSVTFTNGAGGVSCVA